MPAKKSNANARDGESVASYDSTGKKKSFKRLFSRFGEKTSMVGVPYINMAKFWWVKAIWSFLLVCAIAAMGLHLWFLFDQYYSWPIKTNVELGFKSLDFPQVTICNTNIMHKGRFNQYDGAEELTWLVEDLNPENFVPEQYDDNYTYNTEATTESTTPGDPPTSTDTTGPNVRRKRYVTEYDNLNISKYDSNRENYEDDYLDDEDDYLEPIDAQTEIKEIFKELYMDIDKYDRELLGHQISDMLVACTFNGRKCWDSQFQLHQTSQYGNCWTISGTKFKVNRAGPTSGLSLILFLETDEFLKGITTGYGIRVNIQKRNTYPFPADEGIFIPASMETDIGLKLVNITRKGGNYGSCNDGVNFKKLYNMTYTRRACQSFCQMSTVFETCSCFDDYWEEFAFNENKDLKPCRSADEIRCLLNIEKQYYDRNLTCTCENPCSEVSYNKFISQRQWPTNEYARVLLEWVCDRDIKSCEILRNDLNNLWTVNNNFLKLNIYYEDLNFENITESAEIEIQQFLSDVGGAIGLWIGLSILSLCELIHLAVDLCYYGANKIKKGNRLDRDNSERQRRDHVTENRGNDIRNDKDRTNRWPNIAFIDRERPNKSRSLYNEMDYYSDRRNRDRYRDPRDSHDNTRDHYDITRDRDDDLYDRRDQRDDYHYSRPSYSR